MKINKIITARAVNCALIIIFMLSGSCLGLPVPIPGIPTIPLQISNKICLQGRVSGGGIPETGPAAINKMSFRIAAYVNGELQKKEIIFNNVPVIDQTYNVELPVDFNPFPESYSIGVAINDGLESSHIEALSAHSAYHAVEAEKGSYMFSVPEKVGVGLSRPGNSISAAGSMQIDQKNENNAGETIGRSWGPGLIFGGDDTAIGAQNLAGIRSKRTAGENQWGLDFITKNTVKMMVNWYGDVGIGTDKPEKKLEIAGDGFKLRNLAYTTDLEIITPQIITPPGGGIGIGSRKNNIYVISAGNVIVNSGNIGIGTANPAYKVDVAGSGRFGTGAAEASLGTGVILKYGLVSGVNRGDIYAYDSDAGMGKNLILNKFGGKVGIGSDKIPQCSLDVSGQGRFGGAGTSPGVGGAGVEISYSNNTGRIFAVDRTGSSYAARDLCINHMGGKVGVGNNDPQADFDVDARGWIRFRDIASATYDGSEYYGTTLTAHWDGTVTGDMSDKRLKKDIETISDKTDVISALKKVRGIYFEWNQEKAKKLGNRRNIGMIAQEVEKAIPEAVWPDKDGYKYINYSRLTAYLIEINKAQQKRLSALKEKIILMEQKLEAANK